ncbi:MAG TPA: glycosyltransferase family 2 protein [Thermoanaerobaculia bacterium]
MRVSAVVPTLGRSPLLVSCLEALRREGMEILVVDQSEEPVEIPGGLADRVLRPGRNLGFAAGTNLGIAEAAGEWIATVNDDAVVEPGWLAALLGALEADPQAAAAQGINVLYDAPDRADGCGLAWNRWWQAVQIGHGEPAPGPAGNVRDVFGVSATAAVYRRQALLDAGGFDSRLVSYYEDVDLAVRLRAAGWRALLVPGARARHAGSSTGRTLSRERWRLIYGNRYVVARRYLGGGFWVRLPVLWIRDVLDLIRAVLRGDGALAAGIVSGWARALGFR